MLEVGMFFCGNCGGTINKALSYEEKPIDDCNNCGFYEWIFEPVEDLEMEIGTRVVMDNCYEAKKYPNKVWITRSKPWLLGHGAKVVLLEGFTGGFSVDCLKVVEEEHD